MPFEESIKVQLHPDATAPSQFDVDFFYLEEYELGRVLSFIQDVRSRAVLTRRINFNSETAQNSFLQERDYWSQLGKSCEQLVNHVRTKHSEFDLIADPPSSTGYHRPFLAAFQEAFPLAAYCYFVKDRKLEAGTGEVSFSILEEGTTLRVRHEDKLTQMRSILIVDDILSNGLTSSVIIHKLRPKVHPDARFVLACPLRLPAKKDTIDLQEIIAAMGN